MKNVEFKSKVTEKHYELALKQLKSDPTVTFHGLDSSEDIYFNVPEPGRLKLRRGKIENCLIAYNRANTAIEKTSVYDLLSFTGTVPVALDILKNTLGVKTIVRKERYIFFSGCVKILVDKVEGLEGRFIEIEARDTDDTVPETTLKIACDFWKGKLGIDDSMLLTHSYSDMIA